ncbi:MAG: site-specific integrase [Gammaproteobacteria bacterium]|nr:MAG: site-specific integrase [Gammaproteobacteria bacterium]
MATIIQRPNGKWQVKVRRTGFPSLSKTFNTKTDATRWARKIEAEMDRGSYLPSQEAERLSLGDCLQRYLREVTPRKKGAAQELMKARVILRHPIAELSMARIRGSDIARYRDDRLAEGKAASTVIKELALLSHLFNISRREWGMEGLVNPVQLVSKPKVNNQRDRRLLPHEEERLLAACSLPFRNANPWLRPMVILALETAMRKGELLDLRWQDIDFAKRQLRCRNKDPKGEVSYRFVPLSSRAIATLRELPRSVDGKVFQTTDNAIKLAFTRACKRACKHVHEHEPGKRKKCSCSGIEGLRFHDLRHEATSRFVESGLFTDIQVASITGHKTLQMLKRYSHMRPSDLADLLDKAAMRRQPQNRD